MGSCAEANYCNEAIVWEQRFFNNDSAKQIKGEWAVLFAARKPSRLHLTIRQVVHVQGRVKYNRNCLAFHAKTAPADFRNIFRWPFCDVFTEHGAPQLLAHSCQDVLGENPRKGQQCSDIPTQTHTHTLILYTFLVYISIYLSIDLSIYLSLYIFIHQTQIAIHTATRIFPCAPVKYVMSKFIHPVCR